MVGCVQPEGALWRPPRSSLFELIRRDSWHGGLSVRALAAKYGVHRRLVREALTRAEPGPRKVPQRQSARLEPFKAVIDGWLRADLDAPRKQRHTATREEMRTGRSVCIGMPCACLCSCPDQSASVVLFKRAGTEATLSTVSATLFSWHEIEAVNLTQGDDRTADGSQSRAAGGLTGVSQRCLLTGLGSSGPEVLDPIENLVQRGFERSRVAVQLREQGPAFDRGQERDSQTTRVGLAPKIPLLVHGLKAVADRRLPLVESPDEVTTAIREALRQFRDQRSEGAAPFTVPLALSGH